MLIDNAMAALAGLRREPTTERYRSRRMRRGTPARSSLGWTGVHNMSVPVSHVARINALSDAGKLKLRIWNAVDGEDFDSASFGRVAEQAGHDEGDQALHGRRARIARRAALGALCRPAGDARAAALGRRRRRWRCCEEAYDADIQVSFHAIGDEGNRRVLDWMEKTFADARRQGSDATGAGASSMRRSCMSRTFRASSSSASSRRCSPAMPSAISTSRRRASGPDRLAGAYAWRALIDAGADGRRRIGCAGGAGRSADRVLCRRRAQGPEGRIPATDWHPEQAVTPRRGAQDVHPVAGLCLLPGQGSRHDRDRARSRTSPASPATS